MQSRNNGAMTYLRFGEVAYALLVILAFYLLLLSRTGEAHTVWEVLHPLFIPVLFIATFLLVEISLSSENVNFKLLSVIVYSILVHSLFSMIFPVGDLSGQQMVLGRVQRMYNDDVVHGWPFRPIGNFLSELFLRFGGVNFQGGLSVVLARMFSLDVLLVHLSLVPILWGVFTTAAVYLVTSTLTRSEKTAILASLLFSTFPYAAYFGAISVYNSLGFIFFFYATYFMLRYLDSNDSKAKFRMLTFSFFALFSHYLTGIISLSIMLLSLAFKAYSSDRKSHPRTAVFSLFVSFIVSTSLLPVSLIFLRYFRPETNVAFTLDKLFELPLEEVVSQFFLGQLAYAFDCKAIILGFLGPLIALVYIAYSFLGLKRNPDIKSKMRQSFLIVSFFVIFADYRILSLFMSGLPLNAERLWVFRDFIAAPFAALAVYEVLSHVSGFLKARFPLTSPLTAHWSLSKSRVMHPSLIISNALVAIVLSGWLVFSLGVAYPRVAPLQTTWYELEAVRFIEANAQEKYVVIGDIWTIYAGEVVVGINNPRAYYYAENNKTGHDLFVNMKQNPSPQWMLQAMNFTNTTVAYFVFAEPRLGTEEFNEVVFLSLQNNELTLVRVFGDGKLYVFSYRRE